VRIRGSGGSARRPVGAVYDESVWLCFCYNYLSYSVLWLLCIYSIYSAVYLFVEVKHCNK
jgi:hypothetical protein